MGAHYWCDMTRMLDETLGYTLGCDRSRRPCLFSLFAPVRSCCVPACVLVWLGLVCLVVFESYDDLNKSLIRFGNKVLFII